MRVSTALLLVLVTLISRAYSADDIYWEGDDDLANEFLEVDRDSGVGGHLRRLKRQFNLLGWFTPSTSPPPETEDEENVTEDDTLIGDDDNLDNDLNGGSGAVETELEPEPKEKTLQVSFVVMEPYQQNYTDRDSPLYQNFSKTLAEAVNNVLRDLPGTHRASLVRIQSRPADEFSCKVTLDIIVTGDDTNRISDTLREYIRNHRTLGDVAVSDEDYTTVLHTVGLVNNESIDQNENQYNEAERGDSNPDVTTAPDVSPNGDNIFEVDEGETTEEYRPDEGGTDYGRPVEETPLIERPEEEDRGDLRPNERLPDEGRDDYGRQDYEWPTERPTERSQGEDLPYTETPEPTTSNICPDDALSCDDTRCVPLTQRCDGHSDCHDGADELSCPDSKLDLKVPFDKLAEFKLNITDLKKLILIEELVSKRKQWIFEEKEREQKQIRWDFEEEERNHKRHMWNLEKVMILK